MNSPYHHHEPYRGAGACRGMLFLFLMLAALIALIAGLFYSRRVRQTPHPISATPPALNFQSAPPLRALAEARGIRIGVTDAGFNTDFYRNTIPQQFDSMTFESIAKMAYTMPCPPQWLIDTSPGVRDWVVTWGTARPEPWKCHLTSAAADQWEFSILDQRLTWAANNDIAVRVNTLIWVLVNPGWLTEANVPLIPDRERLLTEYVQGMTQHLCQWPGIYQVDMVNEAFDWDGNLAKTFWSAVNNYIDLAFSTAALEFQACGRDDIALYLNDFHFEYGNQKTEGIYNFLAANPNIPIDGLGLQLHSETLTTSAPRPDQTALIKTLTEFAALGYEVALTEVEVPIGVGESDKPALYDEQALWYSDRVKACLIVAACTGFTTWGTHDGASWRNGFFGQDQDPLLFWDTADQVWNPAIDRCEPWQVSNTAPQFCPKPAYYALRGALESVPAVYLPVIFRNYSSYP